MFQELRIDVCVGAHVAVLCHCYFVPQNGTIEVRDCGGPSLEVKCVARGPGCHEKHITAMGQFGAPSAPYFLSADFDGVICVWQLM